MEDTQHAEAVSASFDSSTLPLPHDVKYWLAMQRAPRIGARTLLRLLDIFHEPQTIIEASRQQLSRHQLSKVSLDYLDNPDWAQIDTDIAWLESSHAHVITLLDSRYPELLKQIPDPPSLLYVMGDVTLLNTEQLAIVGSRNPTHSGRQTAYEFARDLAQVGWTLTSGMALGIDGACHEGCMAAGGKTVAVIGTGLDRIYPARHRELAHQIAEKGVLVSEFPLGTSPLPGNFPQRNRIISGLSRGVLVVEAAIQSGSLITAQLALEQNREVFAVPGSIHSPQSRGCNALIRQGAKLVETATHIYEELLDIVPLHPHSKDKSEQQSLDTLDSEYQKLLECVGYEPAAVDVVVQRSGLTADAVCSMLLVLELQGYIVATSGGYYAQV